jgi:hypothetical protein
MSRQMAPFFSMPRQQITKEMYRRSSSEDEGRPPSKRPRASKPKVKSGKLHQYISDKNEIDSFVLGCITCKVVSNLYSMINGTNYKCRLVE